MTQKTDLLIGTNAHYLDPAYYDHAYKRRREDVRWYVEACRRRGGEVLELGCGTGRVTNALAAAGVKVHGVDRMPEMLAHAKERSSKLTKKGRAAVSYSKGDVRKVRVGRRFRTVIAPFNVFMHLYTRSDVEQALRTVREHLAPRGTFIFDVLLPDPDLLSRDPDRVYRGRDVRHPNGHTYAYRERFEYNPVTQVQTTTLALVPKDPEKFGEYIVQPLTQRHFYPQELLSVLHHGGFRVRRHLGDFTDEPLDASHESQVLICGLRST